MPVKRNLWKELLTLTHVPSWHCPSCDGGYLRWKPKALHFSETKESRRAFGHEAWEPDWREFRFSGILICNNENCQEPISLAGHGHVKEVQISDNGDFDYENVFYPEFVSPSPPMIPVPGICPKPVVAELQKAFIASWGDIPAAANHVRSVVERLLDFLKVPKTKLNSNGERCRRSLHERIISFASIDNSLSESLQAVKWLGNVGSHSDEISRDDVFDAFDILEVIFDELFVKHRERMKKIVSVINTKKGPAKRLSARGVTGHSMKHVKKAHE